MYVNNQTSAENFKVHEEHVQSIFKHGAASVLCKITHSFVRNNVVYLLDCAKLVPMYESFRIIDRPYVDLLTSFSPNIISQRIAARVDTVDTFIGSAGSINYGHWLVDDAPRLKGVIDFSVRNSIRNVRVFLTKYDEAINDVKKQCIDSMSPSGMNIEIVLIPQTDVYFFESLLYVSPNSYHPVLKSADSLSELRHAVYQGTGDFISPPGDSQLFVTRRENRGRSVTNADEITTLLLHHGFKSVDVETMTFNEQVALFSRALFVVGSMGAAMTNTIFCRPGCKVLYLAPEGWHEPFYSNLAASCGHNYAVVFGPVSDETVAPHLSSFNINSELLSRALIDLGV